MIIASFPGGKVQAIEQAGYDCVSLPQLPTTRPFEAPLETRISFGQHLLKMLGDTEIDFILDSHGDGMLFVEDPTTHGMDALLHHRLRVPLVSLWQESHRVYFKSLPGELVQSALQSPSWHKAVFTKGHLDEMRWMCIPNCFYLPGYANDEPWDTAPATVDMRGPSAFFSGSQHGQYFHDGRTVSSSSLLPGAWAIASAVRSEQTFLEAYRSYNLGPEPAPQASPQEQAQAIQTYHEYKRFYVACRNIHTRDRFIVCAKQVLGGHFDLRGGPSWRSNYGLEVAPGGDYSDFIATIRRTPICLNFPNGDNETGLNQRHFEITAAGGFLLCYETAELNELFEIGAGCDAFEGEQQMLDKVEYYVAHPQVRADMAIRGQEHTHRNHLFHHRIGSIAEYVRKNAM